MIAYEELDTPVGSIHLYASDRGLRGVLWAKEHAGQLKLESDPVRTPTCPVLAAATRQLREYFAGERREFDVALDPVGTEFQMRAWRALRDIPYGETRSYGQQADAMGRPTAARAVGAANGRNPVSIIVPCHRVVGASGALTGFAGGLATKRFLLELEASGPCAPLG